MDFGGVWPRRAGLRANRCGSGALRRGFINRSLDWGYGLAPPFAKATEGRQDLGRGVSAARSDMCG
jgi:hypothetical protein